MDEASGDPQRPAPIPFIDLHAQLRSIREEIDAAIARVLDTQEFILGANLKQLERDLAAYLSREYAVGTSSGSDALALALRVLGIGPGDQVITSPFSFIASASAILTTGAQPVFADVESKTLTIDPTEVETVIGSRTKAILPVHLYGQCCAMEEILQLARRHKLFVVEDACQAIGAEYQNKKAGSFGDLSCFSFYPTKNLGAYGDGGVVVLDNEEQAQRLERLRDNGGRDCSDHREVGVNSRLDELQAAILLVKFPYLDQWNRLRRERAQRYDEAFRDLPGVEPVGTLPDSLPTYYLYTIRCPERARLIRVLEQRNIGFGIYYPRALHLHSCLSELGYREGDFPRAEEAASEVISLPLFPEITEEQQDAVINGVREALRAETA